MKRRTLVRTGVAGTATVLAPGFVGVSSAATQSGNVELTTTATIPSGTGIEIRIYEDQTGDGTADREQSVSISAGTDVVTEYDLLQGGEAQGVIYWMDITLTGDGTQTPQLDSATITLPSQAATATQTPVPVESDPQGIFEIWDNYLFYVTAIVALFTGVGMASRSLAIGALGGFLAFAYIALETGTPLFTSILYVALVLIFIGFAFKLWRLEMGGGA